MRASGINSALTPLIVAMRAHTACGVAANCDSVRNEKLRCPTLEDLELSNRNPEPSYPARRMHTPAEPSSRFLRAVAVLFGAAAVFHFWRIFSPDPTDPSSPVRHAAFVAINLLVGACLWLRPTLLRFAFGLLVVQQVASHGSHAWQAWLEHHQIDAVSLAIVVVLPVTWAVLWRTRP